MITKLIKIGVICERIEDFYQFKNSLNKPFTEMTKRKFRDGDKEYMCITKVTDLCSHTFDLIEQTLESKYNPEYNEIITLSKTLVKVY